MKKSNKQANTGMKLYRSEKIGIVLFLVPCMIVFLVFYIYPILEVIITSFSSWDGYGTPEFNGLKNYINLYTNSTFLMSLKNFILWSLLGVTVHVGFGAVIAFILYEKPFGWKFTRFAFMAPNVISAAAWAIIYKFVFSKDYGILNTLIRNFIPDFEVNWLFESPYAFWAVTLTWLFYSVMTTLFIQGDLMAISEEVHESAMLDGATRWQVIRKIDLPLCRISLGTSVLMAISSKIGMYENVKLTTAGGPRDDTMSMAVMLTDSVTNLKYGYANAIAVTMIILGIATLLIINKLFRMNESVY